MSKRRLKSINQLLQMSGSNIVFNKNDYDKINEGINKINKDMTKTFNSFIHEGYVNMKNFGYNVSNEENKIINKILNENINGIKNIMNYEVNKKYDIQTGGFVKIDKILPYIEFILDVAGFIPIVGIVADALSIILALYQGEYLMAFISSISLIPLTGSFIGFPLKYSIKLIRWFILPMFNKNEDNDEEDEEDEENNE
jgi:hypothetical protein